MDVVSAIVNDGFSTAVVKVEFARDEFEKSAGEGFGDMGDFVFDSDACAAEEIFNIGRDADSGVFDELEGFVEDAFDERSVKELEFRSHIAWAKARQYFFDLDRHC